MPIAVVVIIRSVVSFFVLLALVRLMGKQQISELTYFDYVVGITIGSICATASVEVNQNLLSTGTGMLVWAALPVLLAYLTLRHVWIRKVVQGEATVVIRNGRIIEKNLRRLRITIDDLISQLRLGNVFDIADVEFALFEPNGKLSVQKKSQKEPVTLGDLKLSSQYRGLPTTLIENGVFLKDAVKSVNLSRAWLESQLRKKNIIDMSQVSLAQIDTTGNLYVDFEGERPSLIITTNQ